MSRIKELKVYPKSTGATWSGFGCHLLKDDLKYIQEDPGPPATQSVVCGPVAAASHGKRLETQPLRLHPEHWLRICILIRTPSGSCTLQSLRSTRLYEMTYNQVIGRKRNDIGGWWPEPQDGGGRDLQTPGTKKRKDQDACSSDSGSRLPAGRK